MHFHIPKPLHGWREFAGEVGIIVIGVLIALGAEQVVERFREHQVASETQQAVKEEIETNLAGLALRNSAEPCIIHRLSEVRAIVNAWGQTGTFATPRWVGQAPRIEADFTRYDAALSGGRIALLPNEEQYRVGAIVAELRRFNDDQRSEIDAWAKLRALEDGAAALSPTDRTMIREARQEATVLDYLIRLQIRQDLPSAAEHGYRPDTRRFHEWVTSVWKSGRYLPSICAPINASPEQVAELTGQQVALPK